MWPFCTINNDWWLLLPLLLGLLCGWWAWARRGDVDLDLPGTGLVGAGIGAAGAALSGAKKLGEAAVDTVSDAAGSVVDGAASVTSKAADLAGDAVDGAKGAAGAVVGGVAAAGAAAVGVAKSAGGAVVDTASGAVDAVKSAGSAVVDTASAGANTVKVGVTGGVASGAAALGLTSIGVAAAKGDPDDLEVIKGIGPKLNGVLNGLGITRFDQIANWSASDVDKVDDHLGEFKDRIGREEWIPQAKLLAAGNTAEWERLYGKATAAAAGVAAMLAIGIPAAVGDADDLLKLKGIGPKLNTLLTGLGVTRFDQIAAWGAAEIDKVDDHLGSFKNRISRDGWVEQAGLLAKGAIAEFEAKFGKLDSENK